MNLALALTMSTPPRQGGSGSPLTPPTLAPFLTVTAAFLSYVAELAWSASNKQDSPGFGYRIWAQRDELGWNPVGTTTDTWFDHDAIAAGGTWQYYVEPFNDAGEGPGSNTVDIVLPGESEAPALVGAYYTPDMSKYYVTPDGLSYFQFPAA